MPAYNRIASLVRQLQGVALNQGLQQKAATVHSIAVVFRLHAVNVNITADHFGESGRGLGVVAAFLAEQAAKPGADHSDELQVLEERFAVSSEGTLRAMESLRGILTHLCADREATTRIALTIEMTQVLGNTEVARIPQGSALTSMFAEFSTKMAATRAQLDERSRVIDRIGEITVLAKAA